MKKLLFISIALCLLSCKDKKNIVNAPVQTIDTLLNGTTKVHNEKLLIIPGEKIGTTSIGTNTESLTTLGKPDFSDAAMGKAWLIWYGKNTPKQTKLMIYTTYKDTEMKEKVVSEIRINSSDFKTKDDIGVGSSFETVHKKFPEINCIPEVSRPYTYVALLYPLRLIAQWGKM